MNRLLLKGKIVKSDTVHDGAVLVENGYIANDNYIGNIPEDTEVIDFGNNYILPSFIEIHAHGGGGYDFIDNTEDAFGAIFHTHLSHGVTTLCPTLCACQYSEMERFILMCEEIGGRYDGFGKIHLEGPFLSPKMCGAQNLGCIVPPDKEKIAWLSEHSGVLARITAAPEIDGVTALAEAMTAKGVAMSIGHSDADAKNVRRAFDVGFSQITHLYSSISQRHKCGSYVVGGVLESALADDNCYVELIGDGHHVSRENLILTVKCKGLDRVSIVSDAMRAAGLVSPIVDTPVPVSDSWLGAKLPENRVILEDGVAKIPDRSSFAGSLAVGDTMVQALCGRYGLPLAKISYMMSATPAKMLGLSDRGQIQSGLRADMTVLDENYKTAAVFRKGDCVYRV